MSAPKSVGRVRSFYGNFGILVRALAYILRVGGPGLEEVTRLAILNANYLRARLTPLYHLAFEAPAMHECVLTDKFLQPHHVSTLDVAKRLLDYGFYAPTIYFPLVVKGALMIEPTETESKETLDAFVTAMAQILSEASQEPERVTSAPHTMPVRRLDDVRAAKHLDLTWKPTAQQ
jgi:glycine dehydrogenase subunit 2